MRGGTDGSAERLWGLTSVVRPAAPQMSPGSITVTSGRLSSPPRPGTALLTAMWSAVEALAPALARELALVRINASSRPPWTHRLRRGSHGLAGWLARGF